MDVRIDFPDGTYQTLQLHSDATAQEALSSVAAINGITGTAREHFMRDWAIAVLRVEERGESASGRWINALWINPSTPLGPASGNYPMLLGRRLFTTCIEEDLDLFEQTPFLADMLYYQLQQSYLSGVPFCTACKAASLSALIAHVEATEGKAKPSSRSQNCWLWKYVPCRLQDTNGLTKTIMRYMKRVRPLSLMEAKTTFLKDVMQLETAGQSLYSVVFDDGAGLLGVGPETIYRLDCHTFEPVESWPAVELSQYQYNPIDTRLTLTLGGEDISLMTEYGVPICYNIASVTQESIESSDDDDEEQEEQEIFNSFSLEAGTNTSTDGDDYDDVVPMVVPVKPREQPGRRHLAIVPRHQKEINGKNSFERLADEEDELENSDEGPVLKRHKPVSKCRSDWRTRALRRRPKNIGSKLTQSAEVQIQEAPLSAQDIDTVEHLNKVFSTNLEREVTWDLADANPMYNCTASTRVDYTLRKSNVTYCSLSQTLSRASKSTDSSAGDRTNSKASSVLSELSIPPELPPKPRRTSRVIYSEVNHSTPAIPREEPRVSVASRTSMIIREEEEEQEEQRNTPIVEEIMEQSCEEETGIEVDGLAQRGLGRQELDLSYNKSRIVAPGEIMRDFSAMMREFRMFLVKLPNGVIHYELASLYQPIHKLITRLCILVHAENPGDYDLFVEGSVYTQKREKVAEGAGMDEFSPRETPSPSQLHRPDQWRIITALEVLNSPKHYIVLPDQGSEPVHLDPKLTFRDYSITTSRILALRIKEGKQERLPALPMPVPDWVQFHQSWLSIIHGNQPCSIQDAITLAAVLYHTYVLNRTEINSVIGFCSVAEFLPPEYADLKGIEEKVLRERETMISFSREDAEQLYIQAATSMQTYNTAFFPCKEPRRHFLRNTKMHPVLLGINKDGVIRMDHKTKQVLDLWPYEVLKNWGYTSNTFMLAFEGSTYPLKTNQGKWIAGLINFYIENIMRSKGYKNEENGLEESMSSTSSSMREQHRGHHYFLFEQDQLHNSQPTVNPCFVPGGSNSPYHTGMTAAQLVEESTSRHLVLPRDQSDRARQYFELEKVYEEMVRGAHAIPQQVTTNHDQPPPPPPHSQQYLERQRRVLQHSTADPLNSSDNHYVNPRPGVSLINPDHKTVERMKRLGLDPASQTPLTHKEYCEPKFVAPHPYQIMVNK